MKLNHVFISAKIINRFGNAWLVQRTDKRHELVGGNKNNFTEAKEWISLFGHEIVLKNVNRSSFHRALNCRKSCSLDWHKLKDQIRK
jgi:hypothetical protein